MSTSEEIAETLECAADYLISHGWQRECFGGCGGPACAVGAINEAMGAGWAISVVGALDSVHTRLVASAVGAGWLPWWNDAPGRTADEVITALLETAARIRTGELEVP